MTIANKPTMRNGINTDALRRAIDAVSKDPSKGMTRWQASTHWTGGTRSETRMTTGVIGGKRNAKDFSIHVVETLARAFILELNRVAKL